MADGRRRWLPLLLGVIPVAAAALAAFGCSAPGASLESSPDVALVSVGAPLHDPVWSYRRHTLVALTDDHRLAEISSPARAESTRTRFSAPLPAGRNLQISRRDDGLVFVPQPQRGTVASVDLVSLAPTDEFDAGPAPAYLAENAGQRVLLALSADGLSVTPVDQYGWHKLSTATSSGAPADTIDGANRGREIDYHRYGRSGVQHYQGPSSPPEERGTLAMDVVAAAGDSTKVTRSYVAERDHNVLYAVDSRRSGQGLGVVGQAELPAPIRYIGTDATRVYAVTDRDVVVLQTASFTGYRNDAIPIIGSIDYRVGLPAGAIQSAGLSGIAIGPHRVYLTLAGQNQLISVAKPRL